MKINMNTAHPSAFISSTFIDLKEERAAVASRLRENGLNVNALDERPASNTSSKAEIVRGIKESDFVILIVGDRYGSILPSMTGSDTRSVTWWEYQISRFNSKPIISFFQDSSCFNFGKSDETSDQLYKLKRSNFSDFKKLIAEQHNPMYFTDSSDLAEKVQRALIPTYRAGMEHFIRINSELVSKVDSLSKQVEFLEVKLNKMELSPKDVGVSDAPVQGLGLRGLSALDRSSVEYSGALEGSSSGLRVGLSNRMRDKKE